ncbi:MAG TPA: ATP-binding protein [Chloroflexi bacterium]|nr:ATP-binding protein [Chloroflexota bacterium]
MARARLKAQERAVTTDIPARAKVLAIASGKGGVGKSSISVNLAVALARRGLVVGLLDADVWGHSVPRLLGMDGPVQARAGKMIPFERVVGAGLLKVISMGFLSGEDEAIMWRGLMLNRAVQHFLEDVRWGALDYLVIDLPPGTGDVQISLAQSIPLAGAVIVTTPQDVSIADVSRGIQMFTQLRLPVLGVVENMSGFICPHCGERTDVFGSGGGRELAERNGLRFLGEIPLDPRVRVGGGDGQPLMAADPASPMGRVFRAVAEQIAAEVSKENYAASGGPQMPSAPRIPIRG